VYKNNYFIISVSAMLFFIKRNKLIYRNVFDIETANVSEVRQDLNQIIRDKFVTENSGIVD
jgi:hypothetical protein